MKKLILFFVVIGLRIANELKVTELSDQLIRYVMNNNDLLFTVPDKLYSENNTPTLDCLAYHLAFMGGQQIADKGVLGHYQHDDLRVECRKGYESALRAKVAFLRTAIDEYQSGILSGQQLFSLNDSQDFSDKDIFWKAGFEKGAELAGTAALSS